MASLTLMFLGGKKSHENILLSTLLSSSSETVPSFFQIRKISQKNERLGAVLYISSKLIQQLACPSNTKEIQSLKIISLSPPRSSEKEPAAFKSLWAWQNGQAFGGSEGYFGKLGLGWVSEWADDKARIASCDDVTRVGLTVTFEFLKHFYCFTLASLRQRRVI